MTYNITHTEGAVCIFMKKADKCRFTRANPTYAIQNNVKIQFYIKFNETLV